MANQVFEKDSAGIRQLLQSAECLECMTYFAAGYNGEQRPFIGYDRAICFVSIDEGEKDKENDRNKN